jgi:cell division protein FtsB
VNDFVKKNLFWIVFGVSVIIFFIPSYSKIQDLKKKNQEFEQELMELEAAKDAMEEERRLLKENEDYLEGVAREKMSVGREGETIYRIEPVEIE